MTQAEKINSIGFFEVNPKVDICKGCGKCDLDIETLEQHTLQGIKGIETVAKCRQAECCQYVYKQLTRGES